ncbi:hypothetical protein AEM51_13075 [Bacteroidetes bacterium UKL13-3]|nr:hypothetical protein AEM51_13075 [Bacteroidetes bacterium UKL13-3]HCP93137.1 hypothetical protein [Bacteroidota bacterium]
MNLDYTELTKGISKDKLCLNYLEHEASYHSGTEKFTLKGVNKIEVFFNDRTSEIRLKANFPYFWQGHNFVCNKSQLIDAIQYTSEMLNLNLFDAEIRSFEFGTILQTEKPTDELLSNHISYNGKHLQPYFNKNVLAGKYYTGPTLIHKMYDAGKNLKNKVPEAIRADLSSFHGYDKTKHYLKVENHYKKPEIHFKNRTLFVNEVLSDSFLLQCKTDLIQTYKNIMKTGIIKLPKEKKDINSSTLPLIVLKELEALYHFNSEDLLMQRIKSIPECKLNKEDKKARKRQIEGNFKKIQSSGQSEYDLSSQLEAKEIT